MRNRQFWSKAIRFSYRKVGGVHFIALGRITFSWSVSSPAKAYDSGLPLEEV